MAEIIRNTKAASPIREIDLISLAIRLWKKKFFILKVTAVFMVIGLFIALFSAKVYTASCVFVPQVSSRGTGGGIASLAAMAGFNLGDMSSNANLSPKVYPNILKNVNFQKDLMNTTINISGWDEPVRLYDYFTDKKYAKFSLIGTVTKYTVGLPFLLIDLMKGKPAPKAELSQDYGVAGMTEAEYKCASKLSSVIKMKLNDKQGYITITARMPEALCAAQVCQSVYDLLQKYITDFKLAKAMDNMKYIRGRYEEAKADYIVKQQAYAKESDANRVVTSKVASIKLERVKSEYQMAQSIYNELSKQLLQANLKVKEDTPMLTAVKPVDIPNVRTKPKRGLILMIWTVLGGLLACGTVMGLDFIKKQGSSWPKNWSIEKD